MDAAEAQKFLPATNRFLESVVRLRPRVAAFDCDGTLWSGDAGVRFFDWELERGNLVADALVLPSSVRVCTALPSEGSGAMELIR